MSTQPVLQIWRLLLFIQNIFPNLNFITKGNWNQACIWKRTEVGRARREVVINARVGFSDVPDFKSCVFAGGGHVSSALWDTQACDGSSRVCKNFDNRFASHVWCPHSYLAVSVTAQDDSVLWVLAHACSFPLLCFAFSYALPSTDIKILDEAQLGGTCQQVVVRKIGQVSWLYVVTHLMELDTLWVVDKEVLFLSYCHHVLVTEEAQVSNELFGLKLTPQVLFLPIHHRNMSFSRSHEQMFAIPCEIHTPIWSKICQIQIKNLLRVLNGEHIAEIFLFDFKSTFPIILWVKLYKSLILSIIELMTFIQSQFPFMIQLVGLDHQRLHLFVVWLLDRLGCRYWFKTHFNIKVIIF